MITYRQAIAEFRKLGHFKKKKRKPACLFCGLWGKGSNPDDAYNFFSVNFFLEKTENKTKNETEIDHLKNHSCLFFGENPL